MWPPSPTRCMVWAGPAGTSHSGASPTGSAKHDAPLVSRLRPFARRCNEALFDFYLGETYALAGRLTDAATWAEHGLGLCEGRRGIGAWGERLLGLVCALRDPQDVGR